MLTSTDANGTTTYTYDANGNQLTIEEPTGEVTTNVWDGENRLVAVEHPDFTVTSYAYNADGLKVEKDDGLAVTRFLYDGNNLLRELDDLGTVEAEFTYVPQPYAHLVSQQRDGDSSFYHFDGIRNTAALSDAAGVVTDEYEHDAWGQLRSSTGSMPNAHTWKGELLAYHGDPHAGPEESIYSLHHRDYVAQQGRFRSEDQAESSPNRYTYCSNDPINRSEASGLIDISLETADFISRMPEGVWEQFVRLHGLPAVEQLNQAHEDGWRFEFQAELWNAFEVDRHTRTVSIDLDNGVFFDEPASAREMADAIDAALNEREDDGRRVLRPPSTRRDTLTPGEFKTAADNDVTQHEALAMSAAVSLDFLRDVRNDLALAAVGGAGCHWRLVLQCGGGWACPKETIGRLGSLFPSRANQLMFSGRPTAVN